MNENRRILLLALGIIAVVASDPPVAARPGQAHTVCSIAGDLAVSVFDSLVRSTLPRSDEHPEAERTDEILVAISEPVGDPPVHGETSVEAGPAPVPRAAVSEVEVFASSAEVVQSSCSGSSGPVHILRVEALMQVRGDAIHS